MGKQKSKFYAVAKGHQTGIFRSWPLCEAQVKGYPGASFKSFATEQEAQSFLRSKGRGSSQTNAPARSTAKRTNDSATIQPKKRQRTSNKPTLFITIQFDGGSRGNPGRAGSGAVVCITPPALHTTATTQTFHARSFVPRSATNNEAEYNGVIAGLTIAAEELRNLCLKEERTFLVELHVQGDSNLVIQQMRRAWKVNKDTLKPYFTRAMHLLEEHIQPDECTLVHVYRSDNQLADQLANEAMDTGNSWYTSSEDGHEQPTPILFWMDDDKEKEMLRYRQTKLDFATTTTTTREKEDNEGKIG